LVGLVWIGLVWIVGRGDWDSKALLRGERGMANREFLWC
jgi:hypothetical protein